MRDYAKISPQFWTGTTGRKIRALGPEAQVLALYLLSAPSSTMSGLYYLPPTTMAHEVGMSVEKTMTILGHLASLGFAHYDAENEVVWVPEMARFQIGETMQASDKRVAGLVREIAAHRRSSLYALFVERYGEAFHLPNGSPFEAPSKPLARPSEAPSKGSPSVRKPLRSQEQEQEQEHEQEGDLASVRVPAREETTPPTLDAVSPTEASPPPSNETAPSVDSPDLGAPAARRASAPAAAAAVLGDAPKLGPGLTRDASGQIVPVAPMLPSVDPSGLGADQLAWAIAKTAEGRFVPNAPGDVKLRFARAVREAGWGEHEMATLGRFIADGQLDWTKRKTIDLAFFLRDGATMLLEQMTKAMEWADRSRAERPPPVTIRPVPTREPIPSEEERQRGLAILRAKRVGHG